MANYKLMLANKVRFETVKGLVTVEDLFDIPLRNNNGFNLDKIAQTIAAEINESTTTTFVPDTVDTKEIKIAKEKLEVVKDIIADKLEAEQKAKLRRDAAEKRRKLLEILEAKREESLKNKSEEEILEELRKLDEAIDM